MAICDKELINKKFEEGKRQLDLRENFYKGDLLEKEKAIEKIKLEAGNDATFNIVGSKATNAAKEAGIISEESIDKIQGIPFALILA